MNPRTIGHYDIFDIYKPLNVTESYDFCKVRKSYFDSCFKHGRMFIVRTPHGERKFTKENMKSYKTVPEYKLLSTPMMMYELVIPHCSLSPDERWEVE